MEFDCASAYAKLDAIGTLVKELCRRSDVRYDGSINGRCGERRIGRGRRWQDT